MLPSATQALILATGPSEESRDGIGPDDVQRGFLHGPFGFAEDSEEPAPALAVGAGIGLAAAGRPVVGRTATGLPGALVEDRAVDAAGRAGGADQGTELHDGHSPADGGRWVERHEGFSESDLGLALVLRRVLLAGAEPGEDTPDVGIQHNMALLKGEAGHRSGRVGADAGECQEILVSGRDLAAVPFTDRAGA